MSSKDYSETIDWLFQQFPSYQNSGSIAYKPGLETIKNLLRNFGNPENELKFIHVAGTNGKGSTCSMLASILTEAGYKVGLFTSPHIHDFRERIRVNGEMVPESFIVKNTAAIKAATLSFQPSFFEISFLLSLLYFRESKCTICVIETGLGGRLDATNSITPIISLITNISLEHTQYLGNTLEAITREKAGIIKKNIPVVIGERQLETTPVFEAIAKKQSSPLYFASDKEIILPGNFPLLGSYQKSNFRLVLRTLELIQPIFHTNTRQVELGLKNLYKNAGFYGRMQLMQQNPLIVFDVSHNEAGIKATLEYFKNATKLIIVYGSSFDKDLDSIFGLFPKEAIYFFTEFSNKRSALTEQLNKSAEKHQLNGNFYQSPEVALKKAKEIANKEDTILVFGSFFLISDLF